MSSVASEYVWMPDPRDPDDGELVETLLLTRRYAIALPETMPRRHVGIPSWQIAGMLDAKREVDEPKIMSFAGRVADALFGEGNWTHGERSEIVARIVNAYWELLRLPCSEMPPEPSDDELIERHGIVVEIDGQTVVDGR